MYESNKLIEDIRQIKLQYRAEVNGVKKQWPRSIRTRVLQLCELGLKSRDIAEKTGISFHTVSAWKNKYRAPFHQLPVVSEHGKNAVAQKQTTVTDRKNGKSSASTKSVTVTVLTPGGYRIEGLDVDQLAVFFKGMGLA
jgi:transposase